jgi:hypothetical protein
LKHVQVYEITKILVVDLEETEARFHSPRKFESENLKKRRPRHKWVNNITKVVNVTSYNIEWIHLAQSENYLRGS